jgi:hypothetical protein
MRYRVTDIWATAMMVFGWWVIVAGFLLGGVVGLERAPAFTVLPRWGGVGLMAMAGGVAGLLVGGGLIVMGQLLKALLDIRRLLVRISRRETQPPAADAGAQDNRWRGIAERRRLP